jgi:hypothetical protein
MKVTFTIGSNLNDSIFGLSQAPIRQFIESRAEAFQKNSIYKHIFNVLPSKQPMEKFTSMTAMSGFTPGGELDDFPQDGMQEGYSKTLEHTSWRDSFTLSREAIDDAKLIDIKQKPQAFVSSYERTLEMFGAALLGKAMSGATTVKFRGRDFSLKTADDVALFSAAHTSKTGGANQGNLFANTVTPDSIGMIQTKMQNFKDDDGNPLGIAPDTIIIPNEFAIKKAVFEAVGSKQDPNTGNNTWNFQEGAWNILVWPYLNDWVDAGDAPFIMMDSKHNADVNDAVWLERVPLEVTSELGKGGNSNTWYGYSRFTAGFVDWRSFAVGGIAGATLLS